MDMLGLTGQDNREDMAEEKKEDRRVQRTRQMLQSALMQLINEKNYDSITIQDITERANLGRTTFYLHYQSKDDLLLDHHADFASSLNLSLLSREQLLSDTPQSDFVTFLEVLSRNPAIFHAIMRAKDAPLIMQGMQEYLVTNLRSSLEEAFPDQEPAMPLEVLTNYAVGAQLSLITWWMRKPHAYDAIQIATMLHQLRRGIIREAYGITN